MAPLMDRLAAWPSEVLRNDWNSAEESSPDAMAKSECVGLPREADWLDTFLLELLAFPNGRHDDQVDSVSQFLKWSSSRDIFDLTMIGMGPKVFVGGIQVN